MPRFRTLDDLSPQGKRILLRADLNLPVKDGVITDRTRIDRLAPTIKELADKGGRVIVCSHFDRPKGKRVPEMSLQPMVAALSAALDRPVAFVDDCVGPAAEAAAAALKDGEVLLLENTRYHAGEEKNDPALSAGLARLADVYVNDAFSAAHRAHASTEGVAQLLPAYAGRLMQAELEALDAALGTPARPVMAIVGGAKVSTKLDLLGNLTRKVDVLVIGGAMANTFLAAQGHAMGKSLQEAGDARHRAGDPGRGRGGQLRDHPADRPGGRRRLRRACADEGSGRRCRAGRHDGARRRAGYGGDDREPAAAGEHPGLERPARRLRDPALRCGDGRHRADPWRG